MKTFPRLTCRVGGAALALAVGLAVFGQEGPEARGQKSEVRSQTAEGKHAAPAATDNGQQTPATGEASPVSAGAALLQQARENLIDKPLEARIEEDVILGQRRFKASGRYVQGPDLKLRLEFTVKVGQSQGTLLEVCDGEVLWTQQKIGERPRITRRNVQTILAAAAQAGHLDENLLTAELGLGGLPALLASIERHMVLDAAREETIDGQRVHVIEGRWNDEFLKRYRGGSPTEQGQEPPELPFNVPERIEIYLDSELYPRRIVYRKKVPGQDYDIPMLTLDFKDIRVNVRPDNSEFQFEPERGVFQEDITRQYTDRLRPE